MRVLSCETAMGARKTVCVRESRVVKVYERGRVVAMRVCACCAVKRLFCCKIACSSRSTFARLRLKYTRFQAVETLARLLLKYSSFGPRVEARSCCRYDNGL